MSKALMMFRMAIWQHELYRRQRPLSFARYQRMATHGAEYASWLRQIRAVKNARVVDSLLALFPERRPIIHERLRDLFIGAVARSRPELEQELLAEVPELETELGSALRRVLETHGEEIAADCDALRMRYAEPPQRL